MFSFSRQTFGLLLLSCQFLSGEGISLLGGRYETSTDVQPYLNLALDAADMKEATDFVTKKDIYENGGPNNPNGVTLQSLSLEEKNRMKDSPMYNIYRHAFLVLGSANEGETEGLFDGASVSQYADTIVNDLFALNVDNIETEAAIVMNVWMAAIHEVFQVVTECSGSGKSQAVAALDKVAALWIGEGQESGSNEKGHLLYNLAEIAGERFDQDNDETEINTKIVDILVNIQTDVEAGQCDTNSGYLSIRDNAKRLIGLMSVPLIQNLIHHIQNVQNDNGSNFVELYALATIPRVAACNPTTYDDELHLDVLRELTNSYQQDAIKAAQDSFSCWGITCADVGSYMGGAIPQCSDSNSVTVAGYSTSRDGAKEKSYLDRDILEIDIFLKFEAYGAALDWYKHGWNAPYSLQDLASDDVIPSTSGSLATLFGQYFNDNAYADTLITNAISLASPYNQASSDQVRNAVTGILKFIVAPLAMSSALSFAIEECNGSKKASALQFWDAGAMLFVGSMEGESPTGTDLGGEFLFSTAKELCQEFATCVSSNQGNGGVQTAAANEVIMAGLKDAIGSLQSNSCNVVKGIYESQILPNMAIPLIQGTVKYASFLAGISAGTQDASLAIGYAFSRAVLPFVNQGLPASADTIKTEMEFQFTSRPVSSGFGVVAAALRQALPNMDTDCQDIGVFEDELQDGDLCSGSGSGPSTPTGPSNPPPTPASPTNAPVQAPVNPQPPTQPHEIAFGRYTFTDVDVAEGDGSFALDVRDMFNAANINKATNIYNNGKNALTNGLSGEAGTVSLSSLSTEAAQYMTDDPMFNIYKYALYDDEDLESGAGEDYLYADDVVQEALSAGKDNKLAAEGAVVMNVWMVIAHRLATAVRTCKSQQTPEVMIDSAVALWIGKEQGEGLFDSGWMLYSVGQSAAKFYGLEEEEAPVNTELMNLFNEAKTIAGNCDRDGQVYKSLHAKVSEINRVLTKPLILSLLFHMVKNSKNMVELYAVAVIPQAAACSPDADEELQSALFSGYNHKTSLTDEVKSHLATFLRCQRITCDDMKYTNKADSDLRDLVDKLCSRLDFGDSNYLPMSGYTPKTDVSEMSRLELDMLEIQILTRTKAYGAAAMVYQIGHNVRSGDTGILLNLRSMATDNTRDGLEQFGYFKDYFGSKSYADDIIMNALQQQGDYSSATRGQVSELVSRALQTMVSYMTTLLKMQQAVESCNAKKPANARKYWDEAAALFIGAVNGPTAGGLTDGDGVSMYSLGNEVCDDFDTCEGSGEAGVNEKILFQFAGGRDSISDNKCDHVERTMSWEIVPRMVIPFIQGILSFSKDSLSDDDKVASAYILSKAILPVLKNANADSATTLEDWYASFNGASVGNYADLFDAFGTALRAMGVDCAEIGTLVSEPNLSICVSTGSVSDADQDGGGNGNGDDGVDNTGEYAPLADTNTNLGDNLYVTTTYVQDKANIALDVKDIIDALEEGNPELAKLIYRSGKNSEIYDENGKFVSSRSLKGFSVNYSQEMTDEPLFNLYQYALQDSSGKFMGADVRMFADTIVEESFTLTNTATKTTPADAIIALNLWMHVNHMLHDGLRLCKEKKLRNDDGVHSMDVAVAYWIGDGQVAGDGERGHLLYALSEKMGAVFNMDDAGQSRTNSNVLKLFNKAKNEISLPGACSDSPASYIRLRRIVNDLEKQMIIPLIQSLIHNLRANDRDRVKIYAHATIPFVAGCSPSSFEYLKEKLVKMTYNVVEVEKIIEVIRSLYPCLGLRCDDIGTHASETTEGTPSCTDVDILHPLAGYRPATDVREYARLDLDLREMDILLQMKAYVAAEDLYLYGRHVQGSNGGSLSFSQLATTSERSIVPQFDAFVRYYESDSYADDIIRSALTPGSPDGWTDEQRRAIVIRSAQVMIMYFGALQAAYEAVSDCSSTLSTVRSAKPSDSWDKAAAMIIGHLEGTETNGTVEGYMYYDLAQEHCKDFGTCLEDNTGVAVNDQIISLLYTGRGAVLENSCRGLQKAADEISTLLLIPVIQGALSTSMKLSSSIEANAPLYRAEGFVYSSALLPLVDDANRDAADTLSTYLGFPGPQTTRSTSSETFAAFAKAYPRLGVDCDMVGEGGGFDACEGVVYETESSNLWIIIGATAGALLCCCGVALKTFRRSNAKLPENNPKFVEPQGELNHSMDLLEKAFSRNEHERTRTPTTEAAVPLTEDLHSDASPPEEDDFEEAKSLKSSMNETPDII